MSSRDSGMAPPKIMEIVGGSQSGKTAALWAIASKHGSGVAYVHIGSGDADVACDLEAAARNSGLPDSAQFFMWGNRPHMAEAITEGRSFHTVLIDVHPVSSWPDLAYVLGWAVRCRAKYIAIARCLNDYACFTTGHRMIEHGAEYWGK